MGKSQDDWMRLFMVPGMAHCGGGPGPNTFDTIGTMEYWRERGVAPAQMTSANAQTATTRPLCPYPQFATNDLDLRERRRRQSENRRDH
jgi:feruloyl esterase